MSPARGRRRHSHEPVDAGPCERATNAALSERDRRRTAAGTRSELEAADAQRRRRPQWLTECHTCVTRGIEKWCALHDSNVRPPGS